jgi:CheY-like chemotaxis protein
MRVLVVDDDPIACEHAQLVLEKAGIACEVAASGDEAVEMVRLRHARRDAFDLILVDWQMPEMDGVETTRRIREIVGDELAIIILTAYRWDDILDDAMAAGVDAFAPKPLFAATVLEEFRSASRRKSIVARRMQRKADLAGRAASVAAEIAFVRERKADASLLLGELREGNLPLRVTHNDTKLNNVLFDAESGKAVCVIDLDTVMPGLVHYDFGDSIRFGASTAAEDEKDLTKVEMDLALFEAYTRGFLASAGKALTEKEIEYLPFSAKLLTYECGMRFLTDYLNGDTYFRIHYPEQNLDRCRTQFKLVADMEGKMAAMKAIVARLLTK